MKTEQSTEQNAARHGFVARGLERAWHWVHATFPERQIYIRSDGRVQFFTFSPSLQATLAGLTLIALAWIAFSTVNVVFKDHIIAAKDHRYQAMQSTYETRVANLQLSYDELNGALVSAEDNFRATADEAQAKHDTLAKLIGQKRSIDGVLSHLGSAGAQVKDLPAARSVRGNASSDSLRVSQSAAASSNNDSEISVAPQPADPTPRTAGPSRASLYDLGKSLFDFVASLLTPGHDRRSAAIIDHPALRLLAQQAARLRAIDASDDSLLSREARAIDARVDGVSHVMRTAGIDPIQMERRIAAHSESGGPLLPLSTLHADGVNDARFQSGYRTASADLAQLRALVAAVQHVPLSVPVSGAGVQLTSDFGPRVDPFTGHAAFHAGLDFGAPWGDTVHATAAGTVVWAGPRGTYGNMVEIDHGMGIHTRYGHMSKILVRVGAHVDKGTPVGRVGSTGRSTGPHVHYEVWLDNNLRDPAKFVEAGQHVLQQD